MEKFHLWPTFRVASLALNLHKYLPGEHGTLKSGIELAVLDWIIGGKHREDSCEIPAGFVASPGADLHPHRPDNCHIYDILGSQSQPIGMIIVMDVSYCKRAGVPRRFLGVVAGSFA